MDILDPIFITEKERLAKSYLAEHGKEVDAWGAQKFQEAHVGSTYCLLLDRCDSYKVFIDGLREHLSLISDADIPGSLLARLNADPSAAVNLLSYASHFVGVLVLQQHGASLLKLAEAELASKTEALKSFTRANFALLKNLGHKLNSTDQ